MQSEIEKTIQLKKQKNQKKKKKRQHKENPIIFLRNPFEAVMGFVAPLQSPTLWDASNPITASI
jgi:hypothetical protein